MYIAIFEDGNIKKVSKIKESDLQSANERMVDLIDIRDSINPLHYNPEIGKWEPIKEI